jgi:nucleotide-binding universal stress UspA family protein
MLKILALTDFSANAHSALLSALHISKTYGAEIIFLHVMPQPIVPAISPEEVFNSLYEADREEAMIRLKEVSLRVYEEAGIKYADVIKHLIIMPTPLTNAILQVVNQYKIDLIVMGISGSTGLKRLLTGSNTLEIISISPTPVLVIPAKYQFKEFNAITIVLERKLKHRPGLKLLFRFIRTYAAVTHFFFVSDEEETITNLSKQDLTPEELGYLEENGYKTKVVKEEGKTKELKSYIQETQTSLLVSLPKFNSGWDDRFSGNFSLRVAEDLNLPFFVIPKSDLA